jgi:hypothetical protein
MIGENMAVKVLAEEVTLNASGSTVDSATVVRVVNTGNSASKVVIKDADDTTVGSITVTSGEAILLEKSATSSLSVASGTVVAVKVAYSN